MVLICYAFFFRAIEHPTNVDSLFDIYIQLKAFESTDLGRQQNKLTAQSLNQLCRRVNQLSASQILGIATYSCKFIQPLHWNIACLMQKIYKNLLQHFDWSSLLLALSPLLSLCVVSLSSSRLPAMSVVLANQLPLQCIFEKRFVFALKWQGTNLLTAPNPPVGNYNFMRCGIN